MKNMQEKITDIGWQQTVTEEINGNLLHFAPSLVVAQVDSSNFLTYTNTDYGFTMKYPSDWVIDDIQPNLGAMLWSRDPYFG